MLNKNRVSVLFKAVGATSYMIFKNFEKICKKWQYVICRLFTCITELKIDNERILNSDTVHTGPDLCGLDI